MNTAGKAGAVGAIGAGEVRDDHRARKSSDNPNVIAASVRLRSRSGPASRTAEVSASIPVARTETRVGQIAVAPDEDDRGLVVKPSDETAALVVVDQLLE